MSKCWIGSWFTMFDMVFYVFSWDYSCSAALTWAQHYRCHNRGDHCPLHCWYLGLQKIIIFIWLWLFPNTKCLYLWLSLISVDKWGYSYSAGSSANLEVTSYYNNNPTCCMMWDPLLQVSDLQMIEGLQLQFIYGKDLVNKWRLQ